MTAAQGIGTPIGIASDSHGGFAVSSVLVPPAIFHVSLLAGHPVVDGLVAAPGPDTGTPFGLAYDAAGSVFFADLGVRPFPLTCLPGQGESDPNGEGGCDPTSPIGSAANTGGFSMVKAGVPVPVRLASNWNYPDGVAVVNASQIDS